MRLVELLEMLRAKKIQHGDVPVVLGVMQDGVMTVDELRMMGDATDQDGNVAVCLAVEGLPAVEAGGKN